MDDIVLTTSSTTLKMSLILSLEQEFDMVDLIPLSYSLGIYVTRTENNMFFIENEVYKCHR